MNNFKSCVPCVCTSSGHKRVYEEHNNPIYPYYISLFKYWIVVFVALFGLVMC